MAIQVIILIMIILINAFFAVSEIAIRSVNQTKIKVKADEGDTRAILLKKVTENPEPYLSTIQIGVSCASIFGGAFAIISFSDNITNWFISIIPSLSENSYSIVKTVVIVLITFVVTYFFLIFGEIVPKRLVEKNIDWVAFSVVGKINFFTILAKPFVFVLTISTNLVLKLFKIDPHNSDVDFTEEEIRMLIDYSEESGMIDESEKERINNIFEFNNTNANDIATHRKDITAISVDCEKDEILKVAISQHYSRIPVYEESIDNIIGILHIKDLIKYFALNGFNHESAIDLRKIIRKAYYIPSSKKTDELFEEMQKNKIHIAVVVDEYGGTVGIVTMEDLIEEIMGSILDEYDEEERPDFQKIDENTFIFNGTTDLETLSQLINKNFPTEDYDTISGFIVAQLGYIPSEDEQPEIVYDNVVFKVRNVLDNRIDSVMVIINSEEGKNEEG